MAPFGSLLSELGFENVDAFTVPFADVKKKYFQWLRQNHPDKQANSCTPQVDPERVRAVLAAWDDFRDFRQGDQSSAASSRREEPPAAGEEDPWDTGKLVAFHRQSLLPSRHPGHPKPLLLRPRLRRILRWMWDLALTLHAARSSSRSTAKRRARR